MRTELVSVLVIDSDAASRNYFIDMLQKNGISVNSASIAREGLISAWKDRVDIIIFDPNLPDMVGIDLVKRLRQDRRTSTVPCVAIGTLQSSAQMSALLSAGCNEYLEKSNQTVPRLLALIPRLLEGEPDVPVKNGKLVAFISPKGGMGTSSLCANIAMCLGNDRENERIALVDMVLPIGSIADIVGYQDQMNLVSLALQPASQTTPKFFSEHLPQIANWHLSLLAGAPDPDSANKLEVNRLEGMLTSMLGAFDFVIIDIGRSLSRISLPVIQRADAVVFIVGTDLSSAILTQKVWKFLKAQGLDLERLFILQNRAVGLEGLTKNEFEQMTGLPIRLTMPYMSGNVAMANNRHEPLVTKFPNDSATFTVKEACLQITALAENMHAKNKLSTG